MAASSKKGPAPEKLPPTENAAYYHSLRVHEQVLAWKNLKNEAVDPKLWAWLLKDNKLWPIKMDIPPAPENILLRSFIMSFLFENPITLGVRAFCR